MSETIDAKTIARAKEKGAEFDHITRGHGTSGAESQRLGIEQERDDRTHRSQSNIFTPGASVTGGMLDRLIEEYSDQVAIKRTLILHTETEIERLERRIKEFNLLKEELKKHPDSH